MVLPSCKAQGCKRCVLVDAGHPVFISCYLLAVRSRHSVFDFCVDSLLGSLSPAAGGVCAQELHRSTANGSQGASHIPMHILVLHFVKSSNVSTAIMSLDAPGVYNPLVYC